MKTTDSPKVTVHKPSEEIIKAANEVQIVPAGGMQLGMKRPGVLAQYRIVEVVGDSAKNQTYMNMVMPILWVVEIDGEPVPQPGTKRELEALIQRLGEDGVNAAIGHVAGGMASGQSDEAAKN